ncbi:MAG: ABC transporter ATP-binding protein [Bacteroidota bacterium]
MIEVQSLSKYYGDFTAVDAVSFRVEKGQTLALVGTSGSGKTTTLKMLNRLIEPSDGRIWVDEQEVTTVPTAELRRKMGYVIQRIGLFPHYTIYENIALVPRLLGWSAQRIRSRIKTLLVQLDLPEDSIHKHPNALSGGQQQRVGIARALAANPPIILMDEPFGALDPITRKGIRKDFMELEELTSKTTVLVTHDVEEAFELADLVCVLDQGKVQQLGTPKELLLQPANGFVCDFLAGKQTELELTTFTLNDLAEHLPKGATTTTSTTVLEALDTLTKSKSQQHFSFSIEDLMKAFQTAKLEWSTPN